LLSTILRQNSRFQAGMSSPVVQPSKAVLVFAMFCERLAGQPEALTAATVEEFLRYRVQRLIVEFHDLFGKVIADSSRKGRATPAIPVEEGDLRL
jgi:hypothetical protein